MQVRVSTLCQKAAGIVLMADNALTGNVRGTGMAVVCDIAHGQASVVEDRDRLGFAAQRCAHDILLYQIVHPAESIANQVG